jgi:hypothetical protein
LNISSISTIFSCIGLIIFLGKIRSFEPKKLMIIGLIIIASKEAIGLAYITNFNEKIGIKNKTFRIIEDSYESLIKIPLVVVTENIIKN